jgi:hypothetical protein
MKKIGDDSDGLPQAPNQQQNSNKLSGNEEN